MPGGVTGDVTGEELWVRVAAVGPPLLAGVLVMMGAAVDVTVGQKLSAVT